MKTLVFSDVHLNVAPDGRALLDRFTAFLRGIDTQTYRRIVILGDLFDFWFEYRSVIFSGYFDVLRALAALRDDGVEIHFVRGNHDFWAGRFLETDLGIQLHDRLELDMGGKRVLFVHGDGLNPRDVSYRVYKKIARFPLVVWLFRQLHPDWAMGIAQGVARGSRHLFQAKDLSQGAEVQPLREYAIRTLAAGEADAVFLGHTHYPVMESHPTPGGEGTYINTGDWLFHQSYVEWDGSEFRLRFHGTADEVAGGESGGHGDDVD